MITTNSLGKLPFVVAEAFTSLARFSYRQSASRSMSKSSSGVHDVLETMRAGRSGRSVGMLTFE